jgi:hypothetical protein
MWQRPIFSGFHSTTAKDIPAASNEAKSSDRGISGAADIANPNKPPSIHRLGVCPIWLVTPASANTVARASAYINASGSPFWYSKNNLSDGAISFSDLTISALLSGEIDRHAVIRWSSAVLSRASAASFSSLAARSIASSTRLFDRFRSSVWMRLFRAPNLTSPTIPNATRALAAADPHCSKNESYNGWIPAIRNSATTPATTNPANQTPHCSHDDDAASSWLSVAYIVPSGRYHAGKRTLRAFLMGVGFGAVMFAILFAVNYL